MVTSNHHSDRQSGDNRPAGALLAGVCADLAQRLGWNPWAIRALFVIGLFIQAIGTGAVYILLAILLPRFGTKSAAEPELKADVLSDRQQRIAELERRFKEMEHGEGR
ncbi:MAG: phage shock protein PspC (stress-responsive transcriptional regulator) [Lysobacterales bacterium]